MLKKKFSMNYSLKFPLTYSPSGGKEDETLYFSIEYKANKV